MAYDGQVVINTKLDDKGLKKGIVGLQDTTVGALKKIKGVMATVGIGVGIATAIKGVNNLIKGTAELTDRVDKMSQKIGMSKRGYQEWDFILSQNGASVDGLQTSIKTLSSAVDEAINGNKSYQAYLDRLGVTIYDTNGAVKSQEALFNDVFVALTKVTKETERTNLASKLLGKAATELAPALNSGADSIEDLRKKTHDLNLVLDDSTIAIGVRFTDEVDRMKRALQTASARAVAPMMDNLSDLATAFTEKAVPAIEKFMSTAFKVGLSIPPIFTFMKAVVTTVLKEIGDALDGPWEKLKGFVNDLLNMPVVKNTIDIAIRLAGDLWDGLKKGVQSGDWSSFWTAAIGVAQFAIGIVASIKLAEMAGALLWSGIQTALKTAGFSTAGIGTAGLIAMVSVGLAVVDAMEDGDWTGLANNLTAALTAALIAGGLTKSAKVGALAFTIAIGFKLGETDILSGLFGDPGEAAEKVKEFFKKVLNVAGLRAWWNEIGKEIGRAILDGILNVFKLFDIVGAVVDLFNNTSVGKFLGMFDLVGASIDLGKIIKDKVSGTPIDLANIPIEGTEVLAGNVGFALQTSLKYAADESTIKQTLANRLLPDSTKAELLLKSTEMGKQIVAGLEDGTASGIKKYANENAESVLEIFRDVWGIHSPSDETTTMGHMLVQGLINGLIEMFPELESEAEKMRDALAKIWTEQPTSPGGGGGGGTPPVPAKLTFGQQLGGIWDDLVDGWKSAREEMSTDINDWATWSAAKFMNIGATLGNALGAGMQVLGQSIATQQQTIEELGNSIEDVQDSLSEAYEDLEDAQDDYNDAVLSGDKDAIKAADKRLKQQQKLIDGYDEQLKALREEKRSVEDGSKAWKDFAKTILGALSDTLYGLGAELAARAILAAITFNWAGVAAATAGSAVAFGAAIALDAWAGSFAEGGIVPQVSGLPSTGDRHVANVNPGELILNQAQQSAVAAQLTMFSRLTDLLSSLQFSSGGGITVNMAGAMIYGLNEEKVGRAIYRNIKTLQHEGVLKPW